MTGPQFAKVVMALKVKPGTKLLLWMDGHPSPAQATVTRIAQDSTWFNADVVSSAAGGMSWTNGRKITPEMVYNISLDERRG